jgi:hypothetical protein
VLEDVEQVHLISYSVTSSAAALIRQGKEYKGNNFSSSPHDPFLCTHFHEMMSPQQERVQPSANLVRGRSASSSIHCCRDTAGVAGEITRRGLRQSKRSFVLPTGNPHSTVPNAVRLRCEDVHDESCGPSRIAVGPGSKLHFDVRILYVL